MARPARRPGNLPAEATSFIGRRREVAEVRKKLAAARLVSLVGPGGVGKTRLAIRAAADLRRGYRHGGWLVELAEIRDPALVSNTAMAALEDTKPADLLKLAEEYMADYHRHGNWYGATPMEFDVADALIQKKILPGAIPEWIENGYSREANRPSRALGQNFVGEVAERPHQPFRDRHVEALFRPGQDFRR